MDRSGQIWLLNASAAADDISEFRVLINGNRIKYVTIDPGLYDTMDLVFQPRLAEILQPLLIEGDWTHAHISGGSVNVATAAEHTPARVEFLKRFMPGITRTWHATSIDYLELTVGKRLRSSVFEATHPRFPQPFVIKFARFEWEVPWLEAETVAYEWIDGHGIGPDFLGHLTEHGRVIGLMISRVEDARHATPQDLDLVRGALQALHTLNIKHGDTNKHNFLINTKGVSLIDFDAAVQNASAEELREELQDLKRQLNDTSGRGGIIVDGKVT